MPEIKIIVKDKSWDDIDSGQMDKITYSVMEITKSKHVSVQKRESLFGIYIRRIFRRLKNE